MKNLLIFLMNNPCEDPNILNVILFIRRLLEVAFIAIPIVLIVLITFDFIKNVTAGNEDTMKKNQKIVIKRLVYAVLLFFVMPIVNVVFSAFGTSNNDKLISGNINGEKVSYLSCWDNAKNEDTIKSFIITAKFKENGGKIYGDKTKTCGGNSSCEIIAPRATKKNSKFVGWYTEQSCSDYNDSSKLTISKNNNDNITTYYACFEDEDNEKEDDEFNFTIQDDGYEQKHYFFVGDSRMCGIGNTVRLLYEESLVCEVGKSIDWFKDTAIKRINDKIKEEPNKKYIIIINLGVNNTFGGSAEKYYNKYNELKNNEWKEHDVIIASVDPVDESKYTTIKDYNAIIEKFNNNLKENLNNDITFCDTYDYVKEQIKDSNNIENDGLHYKKPLYGKLYTKLKECADN